MDLQLLIILRHLTPKKILCAFFHFFKQSCWVHRQSTFNNALIQQYIFIYILEFQCVKQPFFSHPEINLTSAACLYFFEKLDVCQRQLSLLSLSIQCVRLY